jgi:4'-phosphopantetheinyl transferase
MKRPICRGERAGQRGQHGSDVPNVGLLDSRERDSADVPARFLLPCILSKVVQTRNRFRSVAISAQLLPARAGKLTLSVGEAHVWYAWTDACKAPGLQAYYRSVLNEAERARLERFAFEYLKLEYLVTRALCRTVLSAYSDIHPASWQFRCNAHGRPEVDRPAALARMRFNLSNVRSLVACIVTDQADAGIDLEETDRPGATVSIADYYFSASEVRALHGLPVQQQRQRFFELWTLKESYIKARGLGLSLPLHQFSFGLNERPIRVAFDADLNDVPSDWQFRLHRLGERHLMAMGIRCAPLREFRIVLREVVPDVNLTWREVP